MMGIFSSLARGPWWVLAAIALAIAYFGNVYEDVSYGKSFGGTPDLLGLIRDRVPETAEAFAWLESMGFSQQQVSRFSNQPTWFETRAPALAGFFAVAALARLLFGTARPKLRRGREDGIDSVKTINAILKTAPTGSISDEAWDNPLEAPKEPSSRVVAPAPDAQPLRLTPRKHAKPEPEPAPQPARAQSRKTPAKASKPGLLSGLFARSPSNDGPTDAAFQRKLESDPFERLARQQRG